MASKKQDQSRNDDKSSDRVYRHDGSPQTIDNLKHFSAETLLSTFNEINDIGLLYLASINDRFETVAKGVFRERYANKYFVIEGSSESQQNVYFDQFRRFGGSMKAIQLNGFPNLDKNHWVTKLLHKHTAGLEKLRFHDSFLMNGIDILSQHMNITHLTFQHKSCKELNPIRLPKYRRLKRLELHKFRHISKESLKKVFRHNPQLECLIIRDCRQYFTLPQTMKLIHKYLNHLKKLVVVDDVDFEMDCPSNKLLDKFVGSVKCLESLALTVDDGAQELLKRLCSQCKNIKCLELRHQSWNLDSEMVKAIRSLDKIETLKIQQQSYDEEIESLCENLPNLHVLFISMETPNTSDFVFTLLRKCTQLEKITIEPESIRKVNAGFHAEFVDASRNPYSKLEFRDDGQLVGLVTKEKVIWRNKLLHWIGYNSIHNHSNLSLLDLAKLQNMSNNEQRPLDLIFNYLDVSSLYSFYRVSKKCKQLVESYVQQRSTQQEKFIITDEFYIDYDALYAFRKFITNLEVNFIYRDMRQLRSLIENEYTNLKKLYFHSCHKIYPSYFIFPQVRHFVFGGHSFQNECDLNDISHICPHLETLELKEQVKFCAADESDSKLSFHNLEKFIFKPADESQVAFIKELFKDMGTEVIIIDG